MNKARQNGNDSALQQRAGRRKTNTMDEATKLPIGPEEVAEAAQILQRYKAGKAALDKRLVDNELWFRMGHWKNYQNPMMEGKPQPSSGWLFNSIANKHADAMDNYPSPNVLPRAEDDEAAAQALTAASDTADGTGAGGSAGAGGGIGGNAAGGSDGGRTGGNGSGRKKWLISAGAAAAVAVVGGGVMLSHQADPKDTVIDAFKSITAEGQLNPSEEIFGTKELEKLLQKGSAQTGMELSMTGISDESLNQMSGAGIGLDVKRDVDSGRQLLNLSLQYGGGELADAQLYMDDTQIMAAIPALSSRMFTLDYVNDLEGQLINSPYAAQKLEEQGIDIEGLANYLGQYKAALSDEEPMMDLKALWNRYKEGSKAIDDLKTAMTVTKNDKKEFTIDGQSENCRGYHVTLPKDALIRFAKTTREFFLNDETLKQDVVRYLELAGDASSIYAADGDGESVDPEEQQKELWAQAEAVLDNLVEGMENTIGDVTMDVYVRKDGKMAGFSYETDATVEEENVRFYGDVSFGGGYNMLSNVNGALNIEDSDGQIITVSLDKTGAYEAGKSWSGQVIATLEDDEEKYQFILDGDYQIADGSYEVKLDLQSNGASQASLTANGAVSDLSKGESVHIDMDSLRLETTLLNGSSSYVEFAGSYYVNPLEDEIAQPDGVPFDVLASSEEDYNQVTTEITGNLFAILLKVMS